jgi:hypothetical protein
MRGHEASVSSMDVEEKKKAEEKVKRFEEEKVKISVVIRFNQVQVVRMMHVFVG